jgi:UDP-N-acetyl-D-mannosaminuronic acid dehydrogenase
MKKNNILVIGLGYVGLPILALLSKKLFVVGYDINKSLILKLKRGNFNSTEPKLNHLIESSHTKKKIIFSNKFLASNIYYIAVPTPILANLKVDLSFIFNVIDKICKYLDDNDLIILTSTVPVGTTRIIYNYIKKKTDYKIQFNLAFTPETILPGKALYELVNNVKIVGGVDILSSKVCNNFIKRYICKNTIITDDKTAETVKLAQNSYRDLNIAFANELKDFALNKKIEPKGLFDLCNHHPRVNIHNASIGVGGHCLPIDPYFLISKKNKNFSLIKQARKINEKKPLVIAKNINKYISINNIRTVCFFGLSYKENIDDFRNSPAIKIINEIKKKTSIKINIVEPYYDKKNSFILKYNFISHENYKMIIKNELFVFLVGHNIFKDVHKRIISENKLFLDYTINLNDY